MNFTLAMFTVHSAHLIFQSNQKGKSILRSDAIHTVVGLTVNLIDSQEFGWMCERNVRNCILRIDVCFCLQCV